jgi:membrane-associated protein
MRYRRFLSYNVFGGIGWIVSISLLGYFLGQVEWIAQHLEATLMLIIFVSLLPAIISFVKIRYFDKPAAPAQPAAAPAGPPVAQSAEKS